MDLQIVSSTDVQRNFGKYLNMPGSFVVASDSQPKKVMVDYDEYLRVVKVAEDGVDKEFLRLLKRMWSRNRDIDEEKADELIKEALHAAGRD